MSASPDPISPALERVLARFAETVRHAGRGHGLGDAEVGDLCQEVRIRLWRALKSGEKIEAAPASYVYRTAVSAAVDLIRRRRTRREEAMDPMPETLQTAPPTNPGPDLALEQRQLGEQIAAAVATLAASRRPVVRMYLAGYRLGEIADLLGWTEPKTRNLLYRGLADLRARLETLGIGPEGAA